MCQNRAQRFSKIIVCIGLTVLVTQGHGRTRPLTDAEILEMRSSGQNRTARCFSSSSSGTGTSQQTRTTEPTWVSNIQGSRSQFNYDDGSAVNGPFYDVRYYKPLPPLGLHRYVLK